jgi:5-methylcytosine-specific restriction protein A
MPAELVFGACGAAAFTTLLALIASDELAAFRRVRRKRRDMPNAAPTPCRHPGCAAVVTGARYCEAHRQKYQRAQDQRRGSAASRGYDYRWRKAREAFIRRHPLCAECERRGRLTPSREVDHIVPHKGDKTLFWDERNWQALCKPCHSTKTASEDGGFGNGEGGVNP